MGLTPSKTKLHRGKKKAEQNFYEKPLSLSTCSLDGQRNEVKPYPLLESRGDRRSRSLVLSFDRMNLSQTVRHQQKPRPKSFHQQSYDLPSVTQSGSDDLYADVPGNTLKKKDVTQIAPERSRDGFCLINNTSPSKERFLPHSNCIKVAEEIEKLDCFYDIDRECACEWLSQETLKAGTYLIRPSNDEGYFALSLLGRTEDRRREVFNYKIEVTDAGMRFVGSDGGNEKLIANISELIEYFSKNSGLQTKLTTPYAQYSTDFRILEIKMNDLKIGKRLGAGHFSTVYDGTLRNGHPVAVKSLIPGASLTVQDLLEEAVVMHKLRHERLLTLIGFCVEDKNSRVHIVMEKVSRGALKDLLLKDHGKDISFSNLMFMIIQVAEGMSYLESQKFVHRDLRASNVLVTESYDVKIADFGLARLLDQYYKHFRVYIERKDLAFPFKWTAPEAVSKLRFTVQSDVWSFGILLYEIVTYGEEIYLGMTNGEAVQWVITGNRLKKPTDHHCPDTLYKLMLSCWAEDPSERPTFQRITEALREIESQQHDI